MEFEKALGKSTPANINIMSYADDFTIASTHKDIPIATAQLQGYLNTLQTWFDTNQQKVVPTKSKMSSGKGDSCPHCCIIYTQMT